MKLIKTKTRTAMGEIAAEIFADTIREYPEIVLGLATGTSPIPLYDKLIEYYRKGTLDFSRVRTVNLDEYVGLPEDHPQSYRYFMNTRFFDHINIDKTNTHLPVGTVDDLAAECAKYDALINGLGGIDLQLLGIGRNGHIGFNEPGKTFSAKTDIVRLTENTIQANARLFNSPDEVPRKAISLDIKHIMLAKKIVMIATEEKTDIVKRAFTGEITPEVPASVLQMHRDVTVILAAERRP
jgi:glucosamine-6-phosphate deaminase